MIDFDAPPLKDVLPILLRGLKINELPRPRALKSSDEKLLRTRTLAEVFTPSRIVKQMIDALDVDIFWQSYVELRWLEIACGEAPFITNRYDAETGEVIPFDARTGILDRKLRRIPPGVDKFTWSFRAVQNVYGYELQADSLLIARANVLLTFAEFVGDCTVAELNEVAEVIARNFWQFDALKPPPMQLSLFDDVINWNVDYFWEGITMKFDFVIGNPPYQDETSGDNKSYAPPVYNKFMEAAYKVGEKVELITPARFLFDAGGTPKEFNKKMLNDPHFKVLDYAPKADKYFKGVDIEGGVAITLRDETKDFGAIKFFIDIPELNSIHRKICLDNPDFKPLSEMIYSKKIYRLTEKFYEDNPAAPTYLKDKNSSTIGTNAFEKMSAYFFDVKPNDGKEYVQIFGLTKTQRVYKWIRRDYVNSPEPLGKFKVFVPNANGAGSLYKAGKTNVIGTPVIGELFVGATETFITVGAFDTREEAAACLKYIRSKFCRAMLGILKVTPVNSAAAWAKVPLQDFTSKSDIDWGGDVDAQLYRKYALDDAEIKFIEEKVKAMP